MKGIDVSYAQGNIDWSKVSKEVDFAIIREGYGQVYNDSMFFKNVEGAKKAGVKIDGIYHFSYAISQSDAIKEAKLAIASAEKAGLPKSTIIFYDFEYDTVNAAKKRNVVLKPSHCQEFTKVFCSEVKKAGYVPGVYLNMDYYHNWYEGKSMKEIVANAFDVVTWIAKWSSKKPDVPYDYWQNSSSGKINGISVNVDTNEKLESFKMEGKKEEPIVSSETDIHAVAMDVISGKYGNGMDRKTNLEAAGYNYKEVQTEVNKILNS